MFQRHSATGRHLRDVGEADNEGDEADDEDEDLFPLPQLHWILVHECRDEALDCAELRHRDKAEVSCGL